MEHKIKQTPHNETPGTAFRRRLDFADRIMEKNPLIVYAHVFSAQYLNFWKLRDYNDAICTLYSNTGPKRLFIVPDATLMKKITGKLSYQGTPHIYFVSKDGTLPLKAHIEGKTEGGKKIIDRIITKIQPLDNALINKFFELLKSSSHILFAGEKKAVENAHRSIGKFVRGVGMEHGLEIAPDDFLYTLPGEKDRYNNQ